MFLTNLLTYQDHSQHDMFLFGSDRSEQVTSAKMFTVLLIESGVSFMNTTKKVGPSTLPWGMPLDMVDHVDISLLTTTLCMRFDRKFVIHLMRGPSMP